MTTTTKSFGSYKNQYGKWVQDRGPSPKQVEWIARLSKEKQLTEWMSEKVAAAQAEELSGRDARSLLNQLFAAKNNIVLPSQIPTYWDGKEASPKQVEWVTKLVDEKDIPAQEYEVIKDFQAQGLTSRVAGALLDYLFAQSDKSAPKGFLGEIGEKIKVTGKITKLEATYGTYGETNLIIVITEDNKAVKMWSNAKGFAGKKVGDQIALVATVRKYENYKGAEATLVKRPQVMSE